MVHPLRAIPIVHVLFERDDLGAVYGLAGIEPIKQRVRLRAVGAAFRGEEFDKDRRTVRGLRGRQVAARSLRAHAYGCEGWKKKDKRAAGDASGDSLHGQMASGLVSAAGRTRWDEVHRGAGELPLAYPGLPVLHGG